MHIMRLQRGKKWMQKEKSSGVEFLSYIETRVNGQPQSWEIIKLAIQAIDCKCYFNDRKLRENSIKLA